MKRCVFSMSDLDTGVVITIARLAIVARLI
jgi:hypothetical protein